MGQNGLQTVKKLGIKDVVLDIKEWYKLGIINHEIKMNNLIVSVRNFIILTISVPFTLFVCLIYHIIIACMNAVGYSPVTQ